MKFLVTGGAAHRQCALLAIQHGAGVAQLAFQHLPDALLDRVSKQEVVTDHCAPLPDSVYSVFCLLKIPCMLFTCSQHWGMHINSVCAYSSTTGRRVTGVMLCIRMNVDASRFLACFVFMGSWSVSPFRL